MACTVTVTNGTLEQPEIQAYIDRAAKKFGHEPRHIDIKVCGDEVELDYDLGAQPFHRIRRITGYLVVRWIASITPSAPRSMTASSIPSADPKCITKDQHGTKTMLVFL